MTKRNHVLTAPMWWGDVQTKLKGLCNRVFLRGRTARVILTSDTKRWLFRFAYHNATLNQLRCQIFGFIGIEPTRFTQVADASPPNESTVSL